MSSHSTAASAASSTGPAPADPSAAILTVPNALSLARLFGIPLFIWLLLGPHADGWALLVLAVSGVTDWADGVLARALNQMTRLGALLDPFVDRLYILATIFALVARQIIPWWLALVIVGRDLVLLGTLPGLRKRGLTGLPVHYLGKAATFNLLYAFPLLLLGSHTGTVSEIAKPIAWAFTIWGTALYLWSGALYLVQFRRVLAGRRQRETLEAMTDQRAGQQTAPDRGSGGAASALLDELLNDVLDPGYRAAAAGGSRPRRWWDGPMVWIGCVAAGLVLVVAYQQTHRSAPARELARQDLVTQIHSLQDAGNGMEARAKQLSSEVSVLRDAQLGGASTGFRDLEVNAGALAVTGSGLTVSLGEPPPATSSPGARAGAATRLEPVIQDRDIRAVVNQLWAGGAEAIAVNGLRLTPTSFIRFAGESVLVDFQPVSAPYTIEAIGDASHLQVSFADSATASRLKTMESVEGISFGFETKQHLSLQSVTIAQPAYAQIGATAPAAGPSTKPSPSSTEHSR